MKPTNRLALVLSLLLAAGPGRQAAASEFAPPPVVHLIAADPFAAEDGSDPAVFAVIRIGPTNTSLTVQYQVGGTAENGVDYTELSGVVTLPAGAWHAPIVVTPLDDPLVEGNELAVLALEQPPIWPPPYIVAWPSVAFATIEDNDFAPTNQPPLVRILSPPDHAVFLAPVDVPIVAGAFDPDGRVRTVEFFADGVSLGIITNWPHLLAVAADATDPSLLLDPALYPDPDADLTAGPATIPPHRFRLIWKDVPAGIHRLTAVATDNLGASATSEPVTITVLEVSPLPVVTVRAPDPEAAEPDPLLPAINTAHFTLHRTGATNHPLTVWYRLGGAALNGVDYRELPNLAVIPAGARTVDVVIEPLDDDLVEGTESVVLRLLPPLDDVFPPPPARYLVGRPDTARAFILDNDTPPNQPPVVRLLRPLDGSIFRAPADIHLVADARDCDGRVVSVEFFEGTNSVGVVSNHVGSSSSVRPPFSLVWSNVPPGRYVLTAVATDDDGAQGLSQEVEIKVVPLTVPPVVNIEATDPVAAETPPATLPNPATFTVSRTGATDQSLTVWYSFRGSASNGVDYRELPGHVTIPPGAPAADIVIWPIDDLLVEGVETVGLLLLPPPGNCLSCPPRYVVGPRDRARAIILDNDLPPTNLPPRVAIVRPAEGDVFRAGTHIPLYAAAGDPDGFVRTVEFFADGVSLGVVTNGLAPGTVGGGNSLTNVSLAEQHFRLVWSNAPAGGYALTARATDNRGASTLSAPVHIRVVEHHPIPVVTIRATDPYAFEGPLAPIPVTNRVGAVTYVGSPVGITNVSRTATFTVYRSWGTNDALTVFYTLAGTAENGVDYHRLPLRVTIPRGAWSADIVVDPIDDHLVEPTEDVVATLTPMPCPAIWPPPPGCYLVGDPRRAEVFIFDNDINQTPRLAIVEPEDGAVFRAGADIGIDVVACDRDGWVESVAFYANNVLIGRQSVYFIVPPPPGQPQRFSMVWSNVPPGDYVLTAHATDNRGGRSVSPPVRITVTPWVLPVVTIVAVDPVATEPNPPLDVMPDTATFQVRRTGPLGDPLTVFYRIGGTAGNGVDYEQLPNRVVIPAHAAGADIVITPLHDDLVEGTETVLLALTQPPCVTSTTPPPTGCYLVGQPARAVAYIRDNDVPPNQPPRVALIAPADGAVFRAPADIRLAAAAGDPDGWVRTVEFFEGANSLGIVTNRPWLVDPLPPDVPNLEPPLLTDVTPDHPFLLWWRNVPPGRYELTAVATDNDGASARSRPVRIEVLNHQHPPVVSITAPDPFAREGTGNTATFRVRRVGATNDDLVVWLAIAGSAENGVDYERISPVITIPAGRRGARLTIVPIDDNLPERLETVLLRIIPPLVGPQTYLIGRPARAGAVIADNDCDAPRTQLLPDGAMHVHVPLPPGYPFRVEASTNLLDWEPVFSGLTGEAGTGFVDEERPTQPHRFYRVVPEYGLLDDDE